MSTTTSKSIYQIRNKFAKKLVDAGLSENSLDSAITTALQLKYWEMSNVLWKLSFDQSSEDGLNMLGCTSIEEKDGTFIPASLIKGFRNELRGVYSQKNPAFLNEINPEQEECFKVFDEKMNDRILSFGIYRRIVSVIRDSEPEESGRINYLLHSPEEKNFFGGLRSLRLRKFEAKVFKEKVECIAELFDDVMKASHWTGYAEETSGWKAFEGLKKMIEEQGMEIPAQCEMPVAIPEQLAEEEFYSGCDVLEVEAFEKTVDASSKQENVKRVGIAEVLTHLNLFRDFVSVCDALAEEGFELKDVASNIEGIQNIVKGCDALS